MKTVFVIESIAELDSFMNPHRVQGDTSPYIGSYELDLYVEFLQKQVYFAGADSDLVQLSIPNVFEELVEYSVRNTFKGVRNTQWEINEMEEQ